MMRLTITTCNVLEMLGDWEIVKNTLSGSGVTSIQHGVDLSWNASSSSNVVGHNVYRAGISGDPLRLRGFCKLGHDLHRRFGSVRTDVLLRGDSRRHDRDGERILEPGASGHSVSLGTCIPSRAGELGRLLYTRVV